MTDTIFALSSGRPPCAIAIVRMSGPAALPVLAEVTRRRVPRLRTLVTRRLYDQDGATIDRAAVIALQGPGTSTGEDIAEFHVHGSAAVVRALERALARREGVRAALPGEFTRRALENDRIDLTMAEGLGDLLAAETDYQRRAALTVAEGGIRRLTEDWRGRILQLSASVEAEIEFGEEQELHVPDLTVLREAIAALGTEIDETLAKPPVDRLRDGVRVVLAGPPNAGKSTLLNALVGREVAIVSPISGTTRDRIEASVVREGIPYLLYDTAGLTATDDPIERLGVELARNAMAMADIVLWLGKDAPSLPEAIWLQPKVDLEQVVASGRLPISAHTGAGIDRLWQAIADRTSALIPLDGIALNARQHALFADCRVSLRRAYTARDLIFVAEELRMARLRLDQVVGSTGTEDMLDALFGSFCVGK